MTLDRRLAYELVAHHLKEVGLHPRIEGDGLHVGVADLLVRLRTDADIPPEDGSIAIFVWLDVIGIDSRPMSFDISGWGVTPQDQAIDLAHGIVDSFLPPLRWLAGDPSMTQAMPLEGVDGWEIYVGRPWVVAAGEGAEVDDLAEDIRRSMGADPGEIVRRLRDILRPLTRQPVPHWIKVYIAHNPNGVDGRIDVDNASSWSGVNLASSFRWASPTAIQLVRQLLVMRPSGLAGTRPVTRSEDVGNRVRGLFRRRG